MKSKPFDAFKQNYRDLSYLDYPDGIRLVPEHFIRSASLYKCKKKHAEYLKQIGVKTIIDLRTPGEIAKKPDVIIDGIDNIVIPILNEETLGITHERGLKAYKKPPHMPELYASIVTNEESIEALKKALMLIFDTNREGGILWHCTAGKDRAGLLTAFFLSALGYSKEDIIADYCASNKRSEQKGKLYRVGVFIYKRDKALAQAVYDAMLAIPEYILSAFHAVDERFGSMEHFIHDRLGISEEMIQAFKDKYMQ